MRNVTQATLDMLKATFGQKDELQKATISTATGLVAIDLQAPAKNLYPVITLISQRVPRVQGAGGTATQWKQVNSITGSGYEASPWIPEGQRAGTMSMNVTPKSAGYATIGEEADVTFEGVSAARGFEDVQATNTMRLLQKAMRKQELAIIGGNATLQLGTSATPSLTATGSGATLPALTYSVICVQLTFEGLKNSSLANGVATTTTVTGADGKTYPLNGGSGMKSAAATQAITLGQTLTATVAVTQGALGFAWFVGAAGAEKLEAITTVPSATFSAPLVGGAQQAATAITADRSTNATGFDGLMTVALNPANTAYIKQMNGAVLTGSGRSSIDQIDVMLKSMWDNYRLTPTVLYVNSQEQLNITNKVLTGTANSLLNQVNNLKDPTAIQAGNVVSHYFNPFSINGGTMIPILLHPDVPAGVIIGWAEDLPVQYQSNEVPNVAEMHVQDDFHMYDWPVTSRSYTKGVYCRETLAVYAPFAMAIICGIGNG
jgi:hypothetical protein